ncbi:hypothetical protein [Methylobacterium sp. 77]|uniref:hypothetical protein n=1 Tax=Methylobacterium sp. 77 TaxID=1101192 RepID=UPI0003A46CC5|nr:hypothetical protein [Methylobacterium sp. 77]
MSVEPDHKAMAISKLGGSEGQASADAESIVAALERAAAAIPETPPSRKTVDVARRLHGELRAATQGRPDAKALILRGRAALRQLQEARQPDEAVPAREAADGENSVDRRAAKVEAARQRVAERGETFAENVDRMRRIVAALEAASKTENPGRFTEQARLCRQIWDDIGSAGPDGPALRKAYRRATAVFWAKAGMKDPDAAEEA